MTIEFALAKETIRDLARSCGGCGAGPYEQCDDECEKEIR